MLVDLNRICVSIWSRPDLRSRSRSHRSCENCTCLGLSHPPFWRGDQNWWLMVIVWDLLYSLSEPDFGISFLESYRESSNFAGCRHFTKLTCPFFGSACRYSQMVGHDDSLVVLHVLYMLIWPWLDPTSTSRSLTFWSSENLRAGRGYNLVIVIAGRPQQAVRAGVDDRQPPCGAFIKKYSPKKLVMAQLCQCHR